MATTPQVSYWFLSLSFLTLGFLCSCGEKKEDEESQSEPEFEEKVFSFLAEERFDYASGPLEGNSPPKGFTGEWKKIGKGRTRVSLEGAIITHPIRTSCKFDTSPDGPFADYLDSNQMIGKDGTTIYLSYYQALTEIAEDRVAIVEFAHGAGDIHEFTQFNTGTDTTPPPAGPFGLRVKRNIDYIVAAPVELNSDENLIVIKIQFGEENRDRIYYYYNPTPEDERKPAGAIAVDDLSFDRYGLSCFKDAVMTVRHLRVADNFEAVAIDGL